MCSDNQYNNRKKKQVLLTKLGALKVIVEVKPQVIIIADWTIVDNIKLDTTYLWYTNSWVITISGQNI